MSRYARRRLKLKEHDAGRQAVQRRWRTNKNADKARRPDLGATAAREAMRATQSIVTYYAVQHLWVSDPAAAEWVFSNDDGLPHTERERAAIAQCRSATGHDGFLDPGPGHSYVARLNGIARQPGNKTPDELLGLLNRRFRLVRVHDIRIVEAT